MLLENDCGSTTLSQVCGRLAQLVRAPARHAGGHWFESSIAHHLPFRGFRRLLVSDFFELSDVALPLHSAAAAAHLRDRSDVAVTKGLEFRLFRSERCFVWPGRVTLQRS